MALCRYEKWSISTFTDTEPIVNGYVGTDRRHVGYYDTVPHYTSSGDNSIRVTGTGVEIISTQARTIYSGGSNPRTYMDLYFSETWNDDELSVGMTANKFINTNNGEYAQYQVVSLSYTEDEGNGNIRQYWNIRQIPGTRVYYGPYTYIGYVYTHKKKKTLISSNIMAEDGTYPDDGVHTDGYWYVKVSSAINLSPRVNGSLKTYSNGWVRVNGQLRQIDSMWARVNGVLKKL